MARAPKIRVALAAALVTALVSGLFLWRRRARPAVRPPRAHVERVTPGERRDLATRIHDSLRTRSAAPARDGTASAASSEGARSAPPIPRLSATDAPTLALELVGPAAQQALSAAIPLLADCYGAAGGTAVAHMIMFSDPDIGTVIDTDQITGEDGQPLPRQVEDCMRDAIETLALPPLGAPGKLPLQYSFRFDAKKP